MPILPKSYYHAAKESQFKTTSAPTSRLHVPHLINNHPQIWIEDYTPAESMPKMLVLTDWSCEGFSPECFQAFKCTLLAAMKKEGFKFYMWESHHLQPFSIREVEDLSYPMFTTIARFIHPIEEQKLAANCLKSVGKTRDEIQFINREKMQDFLGKTRPNHASCLDTHTLYRMNEFKRDEVLKQLSQKKSPIRTLYSNEFSVGALNLLSELQVYFPQANTEENYKYAKFLEYDDIKEACEENISTSITFAGKTKLFNKQTLKDLRGIWFSSSTGWGALENDIPVKNISLNIDRFDKLQNLNPDSLGRVEKIKLCNVKPTKERLKTLLALFPSLKSLTVSHCLYDFMTFDLSNTAIYELNLEGGCYDKYGLYLNCERLETLNTKGTYLSAYQFRSYGGIVNFSMDIIPSSLWGLIRGSQIKKFVIDSECNLNAISPYLKQVEHLELPFISKFQLEGIYHLKQLKQLKAGFIDGDTVFNIADNALASLESFDGELDSCSQLPFLFSAFGSNNHLKHLKFLIITHTIDSLFHIPCEQAFPLLETLEISNASRLDALSLVYFCEKAPKLKAINFTNHYNLIFDSENTLRLFNKHVRPLFKHHLYITPPHTNFLDHSSTSAQVIKSIHIENEGSQQYSVDANTENTQNHPIKVTQHFFSRFNTPEVGDYRLNVYHHLKIDPNAVSAQQPFLLAHDENLQLIHNLIARHGASDVYSALPTTQQAHEAVYYGKTKLTLTEHWQALPSLSSQEILTQYHVSDPTIEIELSYSLQDNLYYVRAATPFSHKPVEIDFLITVPTPPSLPEEIQQMAGHYRAFAQGALKDLPDTMTGQDYLNAMEQQKIGSCRHRSVAFMHRFQQSFPQHAVRLVGNQLHMYVEIQLEKKGAWIKTDLGGNAVKLDTDSSLNPLNQQKLHPDIAAHNPKEEEFYKPASKDFEFQYQSNLEGSDEHSLIINQLSQYLTVMQKHLHFLPTLSDGICNTLAHWFLDHKLESWRTLIQQIKKWDGRSGSLSEELKQVFELLFDLQIQYQHAQTASERFIGSQLEEFLTRQPELFTQGLILSNAWHAITIRYIKGNQWELYDCECKKGCLIIDTQWLIPTIRQSIGTLVCFEQGNSIPPVKQTLELAISDKVSFFENGGLLTIARSSGLEDMMLFTQLLPFIPKLSENPRVWEGLFLRNLKGIPAWAAALKHGIAKRFVTPLLNAYLKANPQAGLERLTQSMSAIAPQDKPDYLKALKQCQATTENSNTLINTLQQATQQASNLDYYLQQLATWNFNPAAPAVKVEAFLDACLNGEKKQLLLCASESELQALKEALIMQCQAHRQPFYIIHSPSELICSARYILRKGNTGTITKGPGGPLHRFLMQHQAPVLLVDARQFEVDDIISANSMIDENPSIDGTLLPKNTRILWLSNPGSYRESDFCSRFDVKTHCPFSAEELSKTLPNLTIPIIDKASTPGVSIELYQSQNWKAMLLGEWRIYKQSLEYIPGLLAQAIRRRKPNEPIIVDNAPCNNEFSEFMREIMLKGMSEHEGEITDLQGIRFVRREGFDWQTLRTCLQPQALSRKHQGFILNPEKLYLYFPRYQLIPNTKFLAQTPGILEQHQGETLSLYLTRELGENDWARLLSEARKFKVTLACQAASGIEVPDELKQKISISPPQTESKFNYEPDSPFIAVRTKNSLETLKSLKLEACHFIDITEQDPAALLGTISGNLTENGQFEFFETKNHVREWLEQGKSVALTGRFSSQWADHLAQLVLERNNSPQPKGKLILAGEFSQGFSYMTLPTHFTVQTAWQEPDLKVHPIKLSAFNPETSALESQQFNQDRIDALTKALQKEPCAFISGLTGVGKSTFMTDVFAKQAGIKLFVDEDRLEEWASQPQKGQQHVLFIDEANLAHKDWTLFEGLYHNPPGIFINGKYRHLTPDHKVVFAGNPCSYGDERKLPLLFQRHGNFVEFTPMPLAMIYETQLRPMGLSVEAAAPLLEVYHFICQASDKSVLISPREVQMMALLVLSNPSNQSDQLVNLAKEKAFEIGLGLVPKSLRTDFVARFKPHNPTPSKPLTDNNSDFVVTPSRLTVYQQLLDVLRLKQWQKQQKTRQRCYGGLGGLILEGESGIGKSELVLKALLDCGYQQVTLQSKSLPEKSFYRIPADMPLTEKKACLIRAFRKGAVVVIDEINSSPMLERLLNDLLMGTYKGNFTNKPGFFVIGTQNPSSLEGRRLADDALQRRFLKAPKLKRYKEDEMQQILQKKGIPAFHAKELVAAFTTQYEKAKQKGLVPAPNFRDVKRLAKKVKSTLYNEMPDLTQQFSGNRNTLFSQHDELKREELSPKIYL